MADSIINYLRALPVGLDPLEITMLCTSDPTMDREFILSHARNLGWRNICLERMQSSASGDLRDLEDKDVFRMHRRLSQEWITIEEN